MKRVSAVIKNWEDQLVKVWQQTIVPVRVTVILDKDDIFACYANDPFVEVTILHSPPDPKVEDSQKPLFPCPFPVDWTDIP